MRAAYNAGQAKLEFTVIPLPLILHARTIGMCCHSSPISCVLVFMSLTPFQTTQVCDSEDTKVKGWASWQSD